MPAHNFSNTIIPPHHTPTPAASDGGGGGSGSGAGAGGGAKDRARRDRSVVCILALPPAYSRAGGEKRQ